MKRLISFLNILLFIFSLLISYNIFINKSFDNSLIIKVFKTMSNHTFISDQSLVVSNTKNYILLKENEYTNESFTFYPPDKATILDVTDDSLMLKCENGYFAYISNLININVDKLDVVNKSDGIANFIDSFTFYFYLNESVYTYEQIIGNI